MADLPRRRPGALGRFPWARAALAAGAVAAGGWGLAGTIGGGDLAGSAAGGELAGTPSGGRAVTDGVGAAAAIGGGPLFTADGSLVRPEGFERWMLVGASLGMGYAGGAAMGDEREGGDGPGGHFHNVHLDPAAFDHYAATGEFPEGAMLAMAVHEPVRGAAPNRRGWVEGDRVGLEVAVKDSRRFEGGWAYFDFTGGGGGLRPAARPFPPAACAACHAAHAAKDNVFVQFYPVLRELDARRAAGAVRPAGEAAR